MLKLHALTWYASVCLSCVRCVPPGGLGRARSICYVYVYDQCLASKQGTKRSDELPFCRVGYRDALVCM